MPAFLLSPLFKYAMLAFAISAAISGIYLKGRSDGKEVMRPVVEAAKSEAELWQKTAENRKSLIEAQNRAVEGLKASNELRISTLRKQLAVANSEASKFRDMAEKRVVDLKDLKLSDDECLALKQLVDEARK